MNHKDTETQGKEEILNVNNGQGGEPSQTGKVIKIEKEGRASKIMIMSKIKTE